MQLFCTAEPGIITKQLLQIQIYDLPAASVLGHCRPYLDAAGQVLAFCHLGLPSGHFQASDLVRYRYSWAICHGLIALGRS